MPGVSMESGYERRGLARAGIRNSAVKMNGRRLEANHFQWGLAGVLVGTLAGVV